MAVGVTQPGGAGTTIYIYDDASSASGTGYTFAEISAAFPADFVDLGTERKTYASAVSLQVGDTGVGTATTTLVDTSSDVYFASGKALQYRATQTTSWFTTLGTKVGTGNQAGSKQGCSIHCPGALQMRGTIKLYGCRLTLNGSGALTLQPIASSGSELVDCKFENLSTGTFSIAGSTFQFDNIYNVLISSGATTATVLTGIGATSIEKFTIAASAALTNFQAITPNVAIKGLSIYGTPTTSDLRWTGAPATNWLLDGPNWSHVAAKLAIVGAGSISVANAAKETRDYRLTVVDGTGAVVAGVPVILTDATGAVQVNTTTDANGRITFTQSVGTNTVDNGVIVMDHYAVAGVYTQRSRSPFIREIGNYRSEFTWPSDVPVTTTAGQFEDLDEVIPIEFAGGAPTTWVEMVAP